MYRNLPVLQGLGCSVYSKFYFQTLTELVLLLSQVGCQLMLEASEEHSVLCQAVAAGLVEPFVEGTALAFVYKMLVLAAEKN